MTIQLAKITFLFYATISFLISFYGGYAMGTRDLLSNILQGKRYPVDTSSMPGRESLKKELRESQHFSYGDNLKKRDE